MESRRAFFVAHMRFFWTVLVPHQHQQQPGRLTWMKPSTMTWLKLLKSWCILTPWKLTWQENIHHLKMYFLLKMVIFQCHVSFQGCKYSYIRNYVFPLETRGFCARWQLSKQKSHKSQKSLKKKQPKRPTFSPLFQLASRIPLVCGKKRGFPQARCLDVGGIVWFFLSEKRLDSGYRRRKDHQNWNGFGKQGGMLGVLICDNLSRKRRRKGLHRNSHIYIIYIIYIYIYIIYRYIYIIVFGRSCRVHAQFCTIQWKPWDSNHH